MKRQSPVHPGQILEAEFLGGLGITQYRLAKDTGVPPRRINEIVKGKRSITPDTALRLARFFSTTADYWLELQARYDLEITKAEISEELEARVKPYEPEKTSKRRQQR